MSNPTDLVSQFDSDLSYVGQSGSGVWTGVDPERYDDGLWLEESGTNRLLNPMGSGTGNWGSSSTGGSGSRTSVSNIPTLAPTAQRYEITGVGSFHSLDARTASSLGDTAATPHNGSALVVGTSGIEVRLGILIVYTDVSIDFVNGPWVTLDPTTPVELTTGTVSTNGTKTVNQITVRTERRVSGASPAPQVGDWLAMSWAQLEAKAYVTSPIAGSAGDGYAWTSTANASTSTRAASSAAIDPDGILSPVSGAMAFRITPTIETGLEELWGECGVKGSGTDHIQWGRDASKHPFVEWSSNDAAYERLAASETINALTEKYILIGHDGTSIYLQVNDGTIHTDTRAAIDTDWGAGDLVLKASKGGNIVDGFAVFTRMLTSQESARMYATPSDEWTLSTATPSDRPPLPTLNVRTNALLRR